MASPLIETSAADLPRPRRDIVAFVRRAGLVAILVIAIVGAVERADKTDHDLAVFFGTLQLAALLWLFVSGFFGYGSVCRRDWVGLVPFAVAFVVREFFTLHSILELELHFAEGPIGRHSVVYPLLQMFFTPIVRDPHSFTIQMNGILGAYACLPMYLFVRQRLGNRTPAFLCALFLAVHPLIARYSPTDGPYSLLLATWFSGLVLLSAPNPSARAIFGAAVLFGIAATTRMEGVVLLVASLLMLDLKPVMAAARRAPIVATAAVLVIGAKIAVQMYFLLPLHASGLTSIADLLPRLDWLYLDAVSSAPYNHALFMWLVLIGAAAGLLRRYRFGLLTYLAMLVVLAPVTHSWECGVTAQYRLIPACALQAIVAGIGAYSLMDWIPTASRWRWLTAVPGILAAFFGLVQQRHDLTEPYVHTEQYDIVRSHLAPGGIPVESCSLMTLNAIANEDIDIHDFRQVVPGMRILDCHARDCLAELVQGGCFYYFRSAAVYFHADGLPPACVATGQLPTGDRLGCMNEASARFERSVKLDPVHLRTIDILPTFGDRAQSYPEKGEVGLFRVRAKRAGDGVEPTLPGRS